jgi:uncharacterized protein (DUF2062 family)
MHRQRFSRSRLKGTRLHSWLGDGLISKSLWQPTRGSLARAWLVGFPLTIVPFLPGQSFLACIAALLVRGNLLLCIALQFLSTPITAPIQLSTCYFVGEVARGASPAKVWREAKAAPKKVLFSAHAVTSLYLGAAIVGMIGGVAGYAIILQTWRDRPTGGRVTRPPFDTKPPLEPKLVHEAKKERKRALKK